MKKQGFMEECGYAFSSRIRRDFVPKSRIDGILTMGSSVRTSSESLPLKAAVFSSWNHTMGPQMVHMWVPNHDITSPIKRGTTDICQTLAGASGCQTSRKTKQGTFEREAEDLTSQLLHGELHGDATPCNRSKVFVLPGKGLVLHSRVFRIDSGAEGVGSPLALTVVYAYEELERMWGCYTVVELAISRTVSSMKKNRRSDVGSIIDDAMNKFQTTLTKLQMNNGWKAREYSLTRSDSGERPFQERILLSHLQTAGCSLVLAESEAEANQTMQFLLPFLPIEDRLVSFGNVPDKKWSYCPGILIQALIKDKFGQASVWVQQMMQSPHPSTIVDVSNRKVRQLMHSSATSRCCWRHQDEQGVLQQRESTPDDNLYDQKCNLKSVSQCGRVVPEFLKELYTLDEGQREMYTRLFVRHLSIKSAAAVRLADHLRRAPSGIQSGELKMHLGLSDILDLRVFLGSAQKLHPDATSWGNAK